MSSNAKSLSVEVAGIARRLKPLAPRFLVACGLIFSTVTSAQPNDNTAVVIMSALRDPGSRLSRIITPAFTQELAFVAVPTAFPRTFAVMV